MVEPSIIIPLLVAGIIVMIGFGITCVMMLKANRQDLHYVQDDVDRLKNGGNGMQEQLNVIFTNMDRGRTISNEVMASPMVSDIVNGSPPLNPVPLSWDRLGKTGTEPTFPPRTNAGEDSIVNLYDNDEE